MISTIYNAQPVWLLDLAPDWVSGVSAEVTLIGISEAGLTNREGRRAFSQTLRFRTKFDITCSGADARRLETGLRTYLNEPVLVPLWPAATPWSTYGGRPVGGGLNLVYKEDWSQWALFAPGAEPAWPAANDTLVPVLWGRLEGARQVSWIGPEQAQFVVDHTESSPAAYAITVGAPALVDGLVPAGWAAAPKLFPFEINFAGSVGQDNLIVIQREDIGFGRQTAETLYPWTPARRDSGAFFFGAPTEWATMLGFFQAYAGGKAFWAADWVSAADLVGDVAAADVTLHVSDTQGVKAGDYLALLAPDGGPGGVSAIGRVLFIAPGIITLDGGLLGTPAIPAVMKASGTVVSHLILARLEAPKLTLLFRSNDYAEALLKVREVPPEYVPAADETLGVTLGLLPTRCYLYEFSRVLDGATFTDRWTSYENDLNYLGNIYTARKVSHGDIRSSLQADKTQLEVKSDLVAGSALVLLATLQMEAPLMLTVRVANTDGVNAVAASVIFTGEVETASVKGSRITGTASPSGARFDRKLPRFMLQLTCNYALFGPGCTLNRADWQFTATVSDPGVPGYPFVFQLSGLARVIGTAPAYTQDWFAGGWIEFGAGAAKQRRGILLSSLPAAGVLTVTLDRDPAPYPAIGDAVVLYPGCDGQASTCNFKFNNYLNFGGHPFLPATNPSLIQVQNTTRGGKK
ncbi:MAG TPA: phage BR0599 family protein [Candidatus Limnocylindrales bacterium]|nr:phage BR0599 family protein [Candidatus Limnocylindrales bacterium]